jgi:protein SCO1/2
MIFARRHQQRARAAFVAGVLVVVAAGAILAATADDRRSETPLPVLGRVADFALVDQASAPVTRADLAGEPWIANFVFTRCPLVCPRLTDRMRSVQALARDERARIRLVSFSADPEHDRPQVLAAYADAHGADGESWQFLTGNEESIAAIARSLAVALDGEADPTKPDYGIMHSGHLILVDGSGQVRGYYRSAEDGVARRILDDAKRLAPS